MRVPDDDARTALPGVLRIQLEPPEQDGDAPILVADTTWRAPVSSGALASLDLAAEVLAERNVIRETYRLVDAFAADAGLVPLLAAEGTSFWYYERLFAAKWLQDVVLWLRIVARAVERTGATRVECGPGLGEHLLAAVQTVAAARGMPVPDGVPPAAPAVPVTATSAPTASRPDGSETPGGGGLLTAVRSMLRRPQQSLEPAPRVDGGRRERRQLVARFAAEAEPRLLVLLQHARQRVDLPDGPRYLNAYLGPIVERLRGSPLEPIELELRARHADPGSNETGRTLTNDIVNAFGEPGDKDRAAAAALAAAKAIAGTEARIDVDGHDLGPVFAAHVAAEVATSFAAFLVRTSRIERLLRALRPAGILLAVEYNRQDWLGAARAAGVPAAAVQHGLISPDHNGYVHASRPPELALPDRTYVFGRWERDVLVDTSVYRDDEVVVGGSPRLELVPPEPRDPAGLRSELGIGVDESMLVVSGTWGTSYRAFYLPIALAALVDRPLPGVHVVVKLHPGEPDEGPYRAVIESSARAGGFAPPPVTIVQNVDLYRLLAAADAHFGVHSTVLTEAVAVGTLNLIAAMFRGSDLLDYVSAGVAVPVRDGGDALAALARRTELMPTEEQRQRFLDAHFCPGDASDRIARDLLAWLPRTVRQ